MDNFPSNSRHAAIPPSDKKTPAIGETTQLDPIEGLGKVIKRKKPLGRRLKDTFFAGEGVIGYLAKEVLVPAFQDIVIRTVSEGIERAVYGEVKTTRPTYRGSSPHRTHISYDRSSSLVRPSPATSVPARRPVTQPSSRDLEEVILDARIDAQIIAEKLFETLEAYGSVTVANLNELLHQSSQYTDHKYGWTNLDDLGIRKVREGWLLDLPPVEDLRR